MKKFLSTAFSLVLTIAFFLGVTLSTPIPAYAQDTPILISQFIDIDISEISLDSVLPTKTLTPEEEEKLLKEDAKQYVDLWVEQKADLKAELSEVEADITDIKKDNADYENDDYYKFYQAIKEELTKRLNVA
ncbi:MAG: hypothetical protein RM347_012335 [Nostoc sp. ChiQUE02]|uniref:hypothetical protein n=1 Tax=Nostoc sp. ChiQUE02 TaxID=3075377 RepID=UPI002AD56563|nr:hypothetical protein [Nostoc sp. ChiQUE02]MDZ8229425.1 hypothetical protein [Nostoc sp. ChiQUE02]